MVGIVGYDFYRYEARLLTRYNRRRFFTFCLRRYVLYARASDGSLHRVSAGAFKNLLEGPPPSHVRGHIHPPPLLITSPMSKVDCVFMVCHSPGIYSVQGTRNTYNLQSPRSSARQLVPELPSPLSGLSDKALISVRTSRGSPSPGAQCTVPLDEHDPHAH